MEKGEIPLQRAPVIDLSACTDCQSCIEVCPAIFKRNQATGIIEVADLPDYPEEKVQEAIALCPAECISWEPD